MKNILRVIGILLAFAIVMVVGMAILMTLVVWFSTRYLIQARPISDSIGVTAIVRKHKEPIIYIPEVNQSTNQLDTYDPQKVGHNE